VLAEHGSHRFELIMIGTGLVGLEERWLRRVGLNLLTNAFAARPPVGLVTMRSVFAERDWSVEIEDEGAGLAPGELARIFDRFVQFGPADHRARGSGLGLSISRSIARLHGGTIVARNRSDRGDLKVLMRLPRC